MERAGKSKKRRWILSGLGVALLLVISVLIWRFFPSIQKLYRFYMLGFETGGSYTIVDDFAEEEGLLGKFFDGGKDLQNLKNFVGELEGHQDFTYLGIYENPLMVPYSADIPEITYAYGENSVYEIDEETTLLSVKALEVNPNAIEHFDLPLSAATFSAGAETHNLPVILGSSYAGVYAEGDSFELLYFDITFTATVEEILEEGASVERRKEPVVLDDYLIVPFVNCPEMPATEEENTFQAISYSCRANGDALLDDSYSFWSLRNELNRLTDKYSLPEMMYYRPFD